ncbi:MAG: hypothetical protein KDA61_20205 [Planctomycetales bacterium]|nr:hypothetical protein [Planctomycetales bacterium]
MLGRNKTTRGIHRGLALGLAALYAVVGATGESLYYFVESPDSAAAATQDDSASHGYYHAHGAEGHWHYHGHAKGPPQRATARNDAKPAEGPLARGVGAEHPPHSCALLSLVAQMKLGLAGGYYHSLEHDSLVESVQDLFTAAFAAVRRAHLARGPPRMLFA